MEVESGRDSESGDRKWKNCPWLRESDTFYLIPAESSVKLPINVRDTINRVTEVVSVVLHVDQIKEDFSILRKEVAIHYLSSRKKSCGRDSVKQNE